MRFKIWQGAVILGAAFAVPAYACVAYVDFSALLIDPVLLGAIPVGILSLVSMLMRKSLSGWRRVLPAFFVGSAAILALRFVYIDRTVWTQDMAGLCGPDKYDLGWFLVSVAISLTLMLVVAFITFQRWPKQTEPSDSATEQI